MLARRREHCQGSMQPELAQLMFGHGGGVSLVLGDLIQAFVRSVTHVSMLIFFSDDTLATRPRTTF